MDYITQGQCVVDAKSNEITAIPKLLEMVAVSGALVTGRRSANAVRSHWGIENRLHWQLDVTSE
jgi:predicted transposase YbfD/YdcC